MHKLLFIHIILHSCTCFEPSMLIFRRLHCIHAAHGTVTLYERSWWPVGTQIEWECPPEDEHLWLDTCRGM